MKVKLTAKFVEAIKTPAKPKRIEYRDTLAPGLGLRVSYDGTRTWIAACRILTAGAWKPYRVLLGRYPGVPLAEARQKAAAAQIAASEGRDPRKAHREARRALEAASRDTFASVRDRFLQDCKSDLRARTHSEYTRVLNSALFEDWCDIPITEITRRNVIDLLEPLGKRVRANRTLAIMSIMFGWAASKTIIESVPTDHIDLRIKEIARKRKLSDDEIEILWPVFDSFFKVLVLTGQRRGEVAGMRWDEIDLDKNEWTLPGERTKNGHEHIVPLSPPVVEILSKIPRSEWGDFVFSTDGGRKPVNGFSNDKERIDDVMGYYGHVLEPWVLHDLRRTCASGMQALGTPTIVIELCLNHISGSLAGVAGIYQRAEMLPERRAALAKWAAHVMELVGARPALRAVA